MKSASQFETQTIEIENIIIEFIYSRNIKDFSYHLTGLPHMHMAYELHFILDGECPICVDDFDYMLTKNTVCIVPPKTNHYFPEHTHRCEGFGMMMSVNYNKEVKQITKSPAGLDKLPEMFNEFTAIEGNAKIEKYIHDFISAYKNKGFGHKCVKRSALTLIFFALLDELGDYKCLKTNSVVKAEQNDNFMLDTYIMNNYYKNISLQDVSKAMGFSSTHTGRIIKKHYGMSYSALILNLRMTQAKKKVLSTDNSFSDIAQSVGYDSYNGFGMAFKRYFGKTPEQMRVDGK